MAEYFKEKDQKETVETDKGFMIYKILGEECYIEHVYVKPEYRKTGEAKFLLSVIEARAKKAGCKFLSGSVRPSANNPTVGSMAMIAVGFKIHSSLQDAIFFKKELKDG